MNNAAVLLLLLQSPLLVTADAETSVKAGQEALDHPARYPWYDAEADGVRRIDVAEAQEPQPQPPFNPRPGSGSGVADSLLQWSAWLAIALLLAFAAYLLRRAYLARNRHHGKAAAGDDSSDSDGDAGRVEALPVSVRRGRRDLLDEARRQYQQGDYGKAIIYLFSFQLLQLDAKQIIRLAKGKTNRQYLREVGRRAALRRLLGQSMVAFEDVFFGNLAIDRDRFEACWSRMDEFQSLAGQGAV